MPGFQCQLCNINLNSQEQLAQHWTGTKHLKKMKEKGIGQNKDKKKNIPTGPKLYGTFVSSQEASERANVGGFDMEDEGGDLPPPPRPPPHMIPQGRPAKISRLNDGPSSSFGTPNQTANRTGIPPEQIQALPGINPVMKAVMNNALGNLPLKRKIYNSRCDACDIVFNAKSQEEQHYQGKKHAKRMRMVALEEKAGEISTPVLQANGFNCQFCDVTLNSLEQLEQHRFGTKHQKKVAAMKSLTKGEKQEGELAELKDKQ